jgi:hypothetical protein
LTNARVVAESLPTTPFSVAAVRWAETIPAWVVAVIPARARNAPKTMMKRIGRRIRGSEPNTGRQASRGAL